MTAALPGALARWKTLLELFPVEAGQALGAVVGRLAVLVGPMSRSEEAPDGEVDGLAGLARRGPLERLLVTDWALLEHAPEELFRRLAMSELSYLALARRHDHADRKTIALFDAGPSQLGGPRVVHLALAILLATRAHEAGATFGFGVLQGRSLLSSFEEASARTLLEGRTREPVHARDLEHWGELLSHERGVDPWLVCGPTFSREGPPALAAATWVVVEDSLEPSRPSSVSVSVRAHGREPRRAAVELPAAALGVRLLRRPFDVPRLASPPRARPVLSHLDRARLVFSPDGRRLWGRFGRRTLVSWVTLNPGTAPQAPERVFQAPEGHTLLAVTRRANVTHAILEQDGGLLWAKLSKREATALSTQVLRRAAGFELPPVGWPPFVPARLTAEGVLYLVDALGRLVRVAGQLATVVASRPVLALDPFNERALTAGSELRAVSLVREHAAPPLELPRVDDVRVGVGGALALRRGRAWSIVVGRAEAPVRTAPGDEVVGPLGGAVDEPTVVVLEGGRRRLVEISLRGARSTLAETTADIDWAGVSEHHPLFAYLAGDRLVVSSRRGPVARYLLPGDA